LDKANKDINMNLDLIMFMRRIRMHGVSLSVLMKKEERNYMSIFSKKKNIEHV